MNNTNMPASGHGSALVADGLRGQTHEGVTWIDVQNPDVDVLTDLEERYHLHPLHLHESTQKIQHNQIEAEKTYLFFVMHFPVAHPRTGKITFGQAGVFLGKDFVITIRTTASPVAEELFADYQTNEAATANHFQRGAGYVLYRLIGAWLQELTGMVDAVQEELDDIEDLVFDNNRSDAQRIGKVRQKIVRLKRLIGPKRIVLEDLTERIDHFTGHTLSRYYSSNTKTANKLWEVIEEANETVEIYKDADFTTSTEQTNQVLAILTIFFTLTIPATVVGAVYGMNIPLPGGNDTGPWTFLGTYTTLILLAAVSLLLAVAMFLYFRRKHWF